MPTNGHIPLLPGETSIPNSEPTTPPRISNGARTPPEVPEPNATDQITALTISRRIVPEERKPREVRHNVDQP